MSDSIPIVFYVLPKSRLSSYFGTEVGDFLASEAKQARAEVASHDASWTSVGETGERNMKASSRNGMLISGFDGLIERSGLSRLGLLSNRTHTHEIVSSAFDIRETFYFTVIESDFDLLVEDLTRLIEWSRENGDAIPEELRYDYGTDRDGNEFDSILEVIDNVPSSLQPNREICSEEGVSLTLAFSVLKTFRELLTYAKSMGYLVIIEHWGGIESSELPKPEA